MTTRDATHLTTRDISEVATALGITSRTLRYYESEGLIESTTDGFSRRRRYTDEQIETIKQVLVLRALGLPIAAIRDLRASRVSLENAILSRRADVLRAINEKYAEINLLEEALHRIRTTDDPSSPPLTAPISPDGKPMILALSDTQLTIAEACTAALLAGDYAACVAHFDADMQVLLGEGALRLSWEIACTPLGGYLDRTSILRDTATPNALYTDLRFERGLLRLIYVFHGDLICGLWSRYP